MSRGQTGTVLVETEWPEYLSGHLERLGWSNTMLADTAGIDQSLVGRWLSGHTQPNNESVRRVCVALKRDIREGLVSAGLFTAAEMKIKAARDPGRMDTTMCTDDELIDEVHRLTQEARARMAARRTRTNGHTSHELVDSVVFLETTSPDVAAVPADEPPTPRARGRRANG